MKILGLDTSTSVASVALMSDEKLISEFTINDKKTHSQKLMLMIEMLFDMADFDIEDIDAIAVGVGPGSFTGLRIGVSTAKALAHGLNKPVIEVSSLEALAYGVKHGIVCAMMDARRDTVFTAVYGDLLIKEAQYPMDDLLEMLEGKEVLFIGDGVDKHRNRLLERPSTVLVDKHLNLVKAGSICALAKEKKSYDDVHVTYLKKSQAERELEGKL